MARRPILIAAELDRALVLATIPLAAALGTLTNACMHLAFKAVWPFGALVSGVLGATIGVRPTPALCAVAVLLSTL